MDACTAVCGGLAAAGAIFFVIALVLIVVLMSVAVSVIIYCMIFHKAGFHWALGLLTLVPIGGIVMLCILAFCDWPVQKELRQLKQKG